MLKNLMLILMGCGPKQAHLELLPNFLVNEIGENPDNICRGDISYGDLKTPLNCKKIIGNVVIEDPPIFISLQK